MTKHYTHKPVPQEILNYIECDSCRKKSTDKEKTFISFQTHHSDWGNDSIDSYTSYDVCSIPCFIKFFNSKNIAGSNYISSTLEIDFGDLNVRFLKELINYCVEHNIKIGE